MAPILYRPVMRIQHFSVIILCRISLLDLPISFNVTLLPLVQPNGHIIAARDSEVTLKNMYTGLILGLHPTN